MGMTSDCCASRGCPQFQVVWSLARQAAFAHLLCSELRPALRSWYHRHGVSMNPAATEFRDRLSQLAGEKFGERN
jgi:hypothetical protein